MLSVGIWITASTPMHMKSLFLITGPEMLEQEVFSHQVQNLNFSDKKAITQKQLVISPSDLFKILESARQRKLGFV